MKQWDCVAIVGVGLIGGSIGKDLLGRSLAKHVIGIGRRQATLRMARHVGAITEATVSLERGVADADLVVVCTPVGQIAADVLRSAEAGKAGALITDAGSTKGAIVRELDGRLPPAARFVASHPLAGGEKSGPAAAVADLFVGRTVVMTPTRATRAEDERAIRGFWTSLGARVVRMTADDHDRIVAATSHLPHVVAAALAAATRPQDAPLVARGWLDTTRIAAGDPELWKQIVLANREHVLTALARYEKVLASWRRALEQSDGQQIEQLLAKAKQTRDALGS
jgi:prephenate dehydrogenase